MTSLLIFFFNFVVTTSMFSTIESKKGLTIPIAKINSVIWIELDGLVILFDRFGISLSLHELVTFHLQFLGFGFHFFRNLLLNIEKLFLSLNVEILGG